MNFQKLAKHCIKKHKAKKSKMVKKANQAFGYGSGAISSPMSPMGAGMGAMNMAGKPQAAMPRMMARGGIVKKPTIAMIGEEGPEAVIPLGKRSKDKKNAKRVAKKILEKKAYDSPMPMAKSPEFNDKHMLLKCLKAIENMASEMYCEVECGCEMPSWVEYKIYKSKDALMSAIGYTYSKPKAKSMIINKLM